MAYYVYYPCPGSTGAQFYSNEAPSYPGGFIQFTSGGPALAPYLGKCYHVGQMTGTAPAGAISINWATTTYNATFTKCEDCVEQPIVTPVYQLVSCCASQDVYFANLPDLALGVTNIIVVNPGTSNIPPGCYDISIVSNQTAGVPTLLDGINYANNGGCDTYPFVCNSYCEECSCVRVKLKPQFVVPGDPGTIALLYWSCNLITSEEGNVTPELLTLNVPYNGDWTDYVCAGGFIPSVDIFTYETKGMCQLDIQTDTFECPKYYQLQDCLDTSNTLCIANDLYDLYIANAVIQISGYPDICWQIIQLEEPCDFPKTVIITETYGGCEDCLNDLKTYFKLINCDNSSIIIYTETDLSTFVGLYVNISEYPDDCWLVETSSLAISPIDINIPGIIPFSTCEECQRQYYVLQDCNTENPEPNIYTGTDLSAYVGLVITLEYCPEICWLVSETDVTSDSELVNVTGSYSVCEICQVAVLPCQCSRILNTVQAGIRFSYYDCEAKLQLTPPLAFNQYSQKVCAKLWVDVNPDDIEYFGDCVNNQCPPDEKPKKSIRPGYNTPACTPEKYEKIVCNFSEGMYKQLVSIRFGVDTCCGEDDLKWEIQKELIYLKSITDPDYSCTIPVGCDCTTSTVGLTPCIPNPPVPVICHLYELTIMATVNTVFRYVNCAGVESIVDIPSSETPLQYIICGQEGQLFQQPLFTTVFTYNETTTECIDI